jgi:hypothetical protein
MKKIKLLLYSLLLILNFSLSFGQSWLWGAAGYSGIKKGSWGVSVGTDINGNAYVTGIYINQIIFGQDTLRGAEYNTFIIKYNQSGTVEWARQPIDSGGISEGFSIATDKAGNNYVTGSFTGTITFGSLILRAGNDVGSVFIVKYSSSGNVIWAKQSVEPDQSSSGSGLSVGLDNMGNLYVTGAFIDTISFGTNTLINKKSDCVFLTKYDTSGNIIWAKQASTSVSSVSAGYSVHTDNIGNVFVTGEFNNSVIFDSITLLSGNSATFLVKYSPSGNLLWTKQGTDIASVSLNSGYSTVTDKANNCYITGFFNGSIKFDSYALSSVSGYGVYLTKYDSNGNVLWAKQSSSGWLGTSISTDALNNIYVGGYGGGNNANLTFGSYTLLPDSGVDYTAFIVKFDTSGNPICGSIVSNAGDNIEPPPGGIISDSSGNYVYMISSFGNDTVICSVDTLISHGGGTNVFIGRWQNCSGEETGTTPSSSPNSSILLFPNPNTGKFTIQLSGINSNSEIEIYNILGEKVYTSTLPPPMGGGASSAFHVNLSSESTGMYLYRIISETGQLIGDGKFVIEK